MATEGSMRQGIGRRPVWLENSIRLTSRRALVLASELIGHLSNPHPVDKDAILWAPHYDRCPKCGNGYLVSQVGPILTERDTGFEKVQRCPECGFTGHSKKENLPIFTGHEHDEMRKQVQQRALMSNGVR